MWKRKFCVVLHSHIYIIEFRREKEGINERETNQKKKKKKMKTFRVCSDWAGDGLRKRDQNYVQVALVSVFYFWRQ